MCLDVMPAAAVKELQGGDCLVDEIREVELLDVEARGTGLDAR